MNGLFIFTDGGGFPRKDKDGGFDGVAAFRLFGEDKELINKNTLIAEKRTNNFGEIAGVGLGLKDVMSYIAVKNEDKTDEEKTSEVINLITDSKLSYMGLKEWIYNWMKTAKGKIFYGSKGAPVANQEEFKWAFKFKVELEKAGHTVRLYHIKSHYPANKPKKLKELKEYFQNFNRVKITDEEFMFIYLQNKACDEDVQAAYVQYIKNKNNKK